MTPSDIARLRLVSQLLARSDVRRPDQVVAWMGAMQAQDLPMSLWAVGVRMSPASRNAVASALNRGTMLRTHVLRPTWHLVPARDLGWMLDLTAARVKQGIAARHRQLGLTTRAISRSHAIVEQTIARNGSATRAQLVEALMDGGFSTGDNRMAHLLMLAELDQLVCSGPMTNGGPTYAWMADRVKRPMRLDRDEALETLVTRYINSRGPVTLKDYAWWSGLPMAEVRRSFELVRRQSAVTTVGGREYWHRPDLRDVPGPDDAFLLPAYDEFTIAYADRSASIGNRHRGHAISSNGVFRPLVLQGGRVAGTWKLAHERHGVQVSIHLFSRPSAAFRRSVQEAAGRLERFLGEALDVAVTFTNRRS